MGIGYNTITALIKQNRWNSVFFKYLKKSLVLLLIPFFILFVTSYIIINYYINNDIRQLVFNSTDKTQSIISQTYAAMDDYIFNFVYENEGINFFNEGNRDLGIVHESVQYAKMRSDINKTSYRIPYVTDMVFYSVYNNFFLSLHSAGTPDDATDLLWYKAIKSSPDDVIIAPSANKDAFYRGYKLYKKNTFIGYIFFEINLTASSNDEYNKAFFDNTVVLSKSGDIAYNNSNFSAEDISIKNSAFIDNAINNSIYQAEKSNYLLTSTKFEDNSSILISINKISDISKNTTIFKIVFFIIVVLFLILLLFLSIIISWNNYYSILQITSQLQGSMLISPNDEIKYITDSIINLKEISNSDKKNVDSLETTLVNKLEELKNAQFFALQTQITPHFIFNTLNLVNAIAMNLTKGPNDIEKVVSLLSNILYYSLRTKSNFVDINDEIDYTKKFIEIEKIKQKNNFDVNFEYNEDILSYKTLKFILQPIVENCFVHSFPYIERRGLIKIKLYEENEKIHIEVFDNGNKISSDKLNKINTDLKSDELPMSTHLGLRNINMRIQLLWGKEYGCSVNSDETGTTVNVIIPKLKDI